MKVVVDTNVLVAGFLSPFGPPGEIVRMIASGMLSLSFDARIMSEYADVLTRPRFQFDEGQIQMLLEHIRTEGQVVASEPLPTKLPDAADEPFLEVALAGKVQCLITGNMRHFPGPGRQGMSVPSPSEFLDFYRQGRRLRATKKDQS